MVERVEDIPLNPMKIILKFTLQLKPSILQIYVPPHSGLEKHQYLKSHSSVFEHRLKKITEKIERMKHHRRLKVAGIRNRG